mmetsp:Transcript_113047/g.359194  ORF Transcript_113047/g.359194 Transcript_113047/m.359194 type:complete len:102 (+) Transcript_113047:210-515(+)
MPFSGATPGGAAQDITTDKKSAEAHAAGRCKPCIFFYKGVCAIGSADCEHCHQTHSKGQIRRVQPSKSTRMHLRRLYTEASRGTLDVSFYERMPGHAGAVA